LNFLRSFFLFFSRETYLYQIGFEIGNLKLAHIITNFPMYSVEQWHYIGASPGKS